MEVRLHTITAEGLGGPFSLCISASPSEKWDRRPRSSGSVNICPRTEGGRDRQTISADSE